METLLDQNYVGKVLIAHPNLPHDNVFARTVIYLYQDDRRTGTVGVITNKKSRFDIRSLASEKGVEFGDTSQFVYHGGPVNQHALVLLHTNDWQSTNTAGAGRKLCVSSDEFMIEKLNNGQQPTYWRLFGGMSSWKPGQLNAELAGEYPFQAENSWLIADAPEGLLFTTDGDKQWQNALSLRAISCSHSISKL